MANETVSIYEPRTMGRVVSKMPPCIRFSEALSSNMKKLL